MNSNEPFSTTTEAREAPVEAPAVDRRPTRTRRLLNFFWRGAELHAARAELAKHSPSRKRLVTYAQAAAELADRTLDPVDPLRAGSGIALAVTLYAQAFRAAVGALADGSGRIEDALHSVTKDDEQLKRTRDLLETQDLFAELAAGREVGRDEARRLRLAVRRILEDVALPERRVRRIRVQRWTRMGLLLFTAMSLVAGVTTVLMILSAPANLLQGRPWRASSTYAGFSAGNRAVDGRKTDIFFHTNEELSPWIEYDLGTKTKISAVRVLNRGDCCADRAIPIVLEASDDRVTWREVIRRDKPFTTWSERLSPFTARYVRLRVNKQTWLHLEHIALH